MKVAVAPQSSDLACKLRDEIIGAGHSAQLVDITAEWDVELVDGRPAAVIFDLTADPAGCARMSASIRRSADSGRIRQIAVVEADSLGQVDVPVTMDELVVYPLRPGEMEARLAFIDASRRVPSGSAQVIGNVAVDVDAYTVTVDGSPVQLTFKEQELLHFLLAHPNRVFSRSQLLTEVWGYDYFGGTRTVDVHVRRLRFKLGPEMEARIQTVRNVGYRFTSKI